MFRHEYKYLIDSVQKGVINIKSASIMKKDCHIENGAYTVRSLYFDDEFDTCLADNLSGTDSRSKYRIRFYNNDTSFISLEKKYKKQGLCLKETCRITHDEAQRIIKGEILNIDDSMSETKKRLLTELFIKGMKPKIIVTYTRTPFIYEGGNVRITLDDNISSSNDIDRFLFCDYINRPVQAKGQSLLEVKWDEILPKFIKETLKIEKLNWTAFSKYMIARTYHL